MCRKIWNWDWRRVKTKIKYVRRRRRKENIEALYERLISISFGKEWSWSPCSIKYPSEGHEFGKYEYRTLAWYHDLYELKWYPINVKKFVPGQQGNKWTIFKNALWFYIQNMNLVYRSFDILQRLDLLFPTWQNLW